MSQQSKEYITQDIRAWTFKPTWKDWVLGNQGWYIYHYLIHLRGYEYYFNMGGGGKPSKKALA